MPGFPVDCHIYTPTANWNEKVISGSALLNNPLHATLRVDEWLRLQLQLHKEVPFLSVLRVIVVFRSMCVYLCVSILMGIWSLKLQSSRRRRKNAWSWGVRKRRMRMVMGEERRTRKARRENDQVSLQVAANSLQISNFVAKTTQFSQWNY